MRFSFTFYNVRGYKVTVVVVIVDNKNAAATPQQ